jgi:hypothetical protein
MVLDEFIDEPLVTQIRTIVRVARFLPEAKTREMLATALEARFPLRKPHR